jgi:peptide subunit release factor 1 (eRF1)
MLDELLGRASLKERIADLEAERDSLAEQLEAESERRSDAATARQEAEREVNRLEDRVAELEDRVERLQDEDGDLDVRAVEACRGGRLAEVLDRLTSVETEPEGALTAVLDEEVPDAVREAFGGRAPLVERATPCVALTDDAGVVSAGLTAPTGPEPRVEWGDRFDLDRSWFEPSGEYALALVRSDLFALGEYDGRERLDVEGFESDVKGDHSKGGFSQGRFERRRDAQIEEHLDRCREALTDRDAERLYVVGEDTLLGEFDADATAAVDATGKPEEALEDAFQQFWTVRLYAL